MTIYLESSREDRRLTEYIVGEPDFHYPYRNDITNFIDEHSLIDKHTFRMCFPDVPIVLVELMLYELKNKTGIAMVRENYTYCSSEWHNLAIYKRDPFTIETKKRG